MTDVFIPPKTLAELNGQHVAGERHAALFKIAIPLIGNGFSDESVFIELRNRFDAEKTDKEIRDVIAWSRKLNPSPSGFGQQPVIHQYVQPAKPVPKPTPETSLAIAKAFLVGSGCSESDLSEASLQPLPDDWQEGAALLFKCLYNASELINVVCAHTVTEKGKANPQGSGKTIARDEWISWFEEKGVPHGKAGAWVRPNPCAAVGSGTDGAICDADITRFAFALIESDWLPLEIQIALYAKWKLPIAAVILSGGDSAHAWVHIGAATEAEYRAMVARLLGLIHRFGFDQSNKNPSRLSRLPGVIRKIGASGDGRQRLIYLNPKAPALTEAGIAVFEAQISESVIPEQPLSDAVTEAVERYKDIHLNRHKTGVMTGYQEFDRITGGLKNGNLVVVAAETNVGKSGFALNIINHVVMKSRLNAALFSLEMDTAEIVDLLFSMNYLIDRNHFNTGAFTQIELDMIAAHKQDISNLPLRVFDDPNMTTDQIRQTCLKLKTEFDLRLVVVDYLQLVAPANMLRENREQQIAAISRALKALGKECKLPVIALSQLNEEGKIRESRAVAHDAHIVIILEPEGDDLLMRVVKGRSIPKDEYQVGFKGKYCQMFQELRTSVP